MCGIVYSGPYAVDEIVAYEDKNAGQQSLPLRSLDAVEQQESQKDTVESEDRSGSSGTDRFRMHIEAEDSRTESRQQIRDEHTTRTYQMFQPDTYIYKGVHIHQQMESADMHKVAGHGTPPVTGQGERTEVGAPVQQGQCGRFQNSRSGSCHQYEDKDIDVYQNRCRDESFPGDKEMDERRLFFAFCLKPPFFFRQRAGEVFFQLVGFLCQFFRCQS